MKKILFIALLFFGVYSNAQKVKAEVIELDTLTTTERNALTVPAGKVQVVYDETIGDFYVNVKNGGWVTLASLVGGISNLVEDTTPELGGLLDAQNFGIDNVGVLTVGTYIDLTNDIRFVPDNLIGSTTGSNTFGFKTGNVLYGQKVNETIELGLDFNALTADKNLVFTDSDITWGGTSLLSGGGSSPPFDDTTSLVQDPVDGTKEVRIDAGNVPTGTTVTLTAPSSDLNLGNVILGPASATNSAIALFDGTTGKLLKNSTVAISSGSLSGVQSISFTGTNANISLTPTDTEPTASEGKIYSDNSEDRPKYYDGTSWKAFLLSGDATDDQTASEVNITDAAGYFDASNVEAALAEAVGLIDTKFDNAGGTIGGNINFQDTYKATGLANPTVGGDAVNLSYLQGKEGSGFVTVHPESSETGIRVFIGTEAEIAAATLATSDMAVCTDCKTKYVYTVPITSQGGDIAVGTSVTSFFTTRAITVTNVWASLSTAPTGSVATFDINEDGTTILSTKITIDATEKTSNTAATPPVISDTSIAAFAELTFDIDGVGSSTPGTTGTIYIEYTVD